MRIVYLAIGDELLRGESREGNGSVLADRLAARGLALGEVRVLPDAADVVVGALRELTARPVVVVCSGGLGPTDDDVTREAVAAAFGLDLVRHDELLTGLRDRYARAGRTMHPTNERQCDLPTGASPLVNAHGTAPGFTLRAGPATVACLPGVPREFSGMLDDHLDDLLAGADLPVLRRREVTLRLFGIAESDMQGVLSSLPHYRAVAMRSLPDYPEIRLKLAERGSPEDFDALLHEARQALAWRIYAEREDDSHAGATLRVLQQRQATLAVAESCTGGLIGHLLTEVPGASDTLLLDAVTYANAAKTEVLGVPEEALAQHGAVSEAVAQWMAVGARAVSGATVAVAVTGIAGPSGGGPDKPVGTVCFGLATPEGASARTHRFLGLDRSRFKRMAAHTALSMVRRWALGLAEGA